MPRVRASAVLLCLGLAVSPALAQPAAAPPPESAITLGKDALERFRQGDFRAALQGFERADQLAHSPVFVLYMARCRRALDELLEARRLYERLAAEEIPPGAPAPWQQAKDDGKAEQAELDEVVPRLLLAPTQPLPPDADILLDQKPLPRESWARPIEVDPGQHTVGVYVGDRHQEQQEVFVREGEVKTVTLEVSGGTPAPTPPPLPPPDPPPPAPEPEPGSIVPGAVLLGLAGAAVVVGAATWGAALSKAGEVKERCTGDVCLPADQETADQAIVLSHVATGSFAVAAAAGVVGVVLVIVRPGGEDAGGAITIGPASVGFRYPF
jgi:hypothetical protein